MKRIGALILLLTLCLFASTALAEASPVVRGDGFAAYTDGDGHLYLAGREAAINTTTADSVVSVDAYRALFLSADEFLGTNNLYMIDLDSLEEDLVAKDVVDACLLDEDTAYYVSGANRAQLMRVNLEDLSSEVAYKASEAIDRLYLSAEGLVFQMVDQAGAMLYVQETDSFEVYSEALPRSSMLTGGDELYLTDDNELYLRSGYNYTSTLIDADVTAYTVMNGSVYYLNRTGSALRLKAYDLSTSTSKIVLTPGVKMENQLTATDNRLFMLTTEGNVCQVKVSDGTLSVFKHYNDLSSYKLPDGYDVEGLRIEGMGGQLNVYAVLHDKNAKPTFSFIEFEAESESASPKLKLIDVNKLAAETATTNRLAPAAQYTTLAFGSRGDAVRAIQKPLKDLGYYDYYVDGIYGPRTQAAVQLLQFDLDLPMTGVADADLQRTILSGGLKNYDPYKMLTRGNRGLRVRLMQERLRELGYLADVADGIFGPRTLKAVQLFQSENGIQVENTATRETLRRLFADSASRCSSFIDLYPGDTGYRVRELNNRLKELYYLESSPGSTYTSETTSAVRVFQRTAGFRENGEASKSVQRALFAYDAPEAPGYIVLRRGDSNERVERLQRRLKDLGYYTGRVDGYFGKQTREAVALFQRKVGLKPTGIATVRTQQLLFSDDAPEYVKPTVIGVPEIEVEDYDYVRSAIYFISEDSTTDGYAIFSWDTEGDVESYNVTVTDAMGNVFVDSDTLMTSTGVSLVTLDYDTVYTLTITAYPEDGNTRHITEAAVSFARIDVEEVYEIISSVGTPDISISAVARVENGVNYVLPGTVNFGWYAEGDVGSYYVEVRDETDNVIVSVTTTDLQASISTGAMNVGEVYTIFVYAIPANGTMDNARVKFLRFALPEVTLPEPDPTPVPTPTPTPEPTVEPDLESVIAPVPDDTLVGEDGATPEPVATAEATPEPTPEPVVEMTPEPVEEAVPDVQEEIPAEPTNEFEPEQAVEESEPEQPSDEFEAEQAEEEFEPEQTEAEPEPEQPEVEPEQPEAEPEQQEEASDEAPAEGSGVTAPVITFDSVAMEENGVNYLSGEFVNITWTAEGDVGSYHEELNDSQGNLLDSRDMDTNTLSARMEMLDPNEVYTLTITAIPAGGSIEQGASSSTMFAVYVAPDADQQDFEVADADPQESDFQPEDNYQVPEDNGTDYQEPEESYQEPEESYQEPEESYQEPEESYQEPEESYQEPEESYQEPEESYQEPEESYQEPEESYQEPEESYQEPEESYQEPEESYQEPEESYQEPEESYQEPEDINEEGIDVDTDGDGVVEIDIALIQDKLVQLGWLQAETYVIGELDLPTINAISSFQLYCNTQYAMALPTIDPENPVIDVETATLLMNDTEGTYTNPDAVPVA